MYAILINYIIEFIIASSQLKRKEDVIVDARHVNNSIILLSCLCCLDPTKTRKIKTIVEEVVDGKVVASHVKEVEEKI